MCDLHAYHDAAIRSVEAARAIAILGEKCRRGWNPPNLILMDAIEQTLADLRHALDAAETAPDALRSAIMQAGEGKYTLLDINDVSAHQAAVSLGEELLRPHPLRVPGVPGKPLWKLALDNLAPLLRRSPNPLEQLKDAEVALKRERLHVGGENERKTKTVSGKRSTEKGEARVKLVAGLTKHHKYDQGGCLNFEPIGCNKLARQTKVVQATASAFFKEVFGSHLGYKLACANESALIAKLLVLNSDYAAMNTFGHTPPGEGWDEDE